jgi:5-methylcytosine-specific restriction enzyme A
MRPAFHKRGYSREWDKLAVKFKAKHPYCLGCWCCGIRELAVVVDHVIPVRSDRASALDVDNLQCLCKWHHDTAKRSIELHWRLGQLPQSALWMSSPHATKYTRERMPRQIGIDGYPLYDFGPPPGPYPTYQVSGHD